MGLALFLIIFLNNLNFYIMDNKFSVFGLTVEQTEVLFALQRKLTSNDITLERNKKPLIGSNKSGQKLLWLDSWDKSINDYVKSLNGNSRQITINDCELMNKIKRIDIDAQNKVWKYMVFLECVLYKPYYPLDIDKDAYKPFKGLTIDNKGRALMLQEISKILDVDSKYIKIFENSYSSAMKKLSGYWAKVAISAGVGVLVILIAIVTFQYQIIAFFAASGLHGAAAISAGLAALGGGAISAGGFGMMGGIAVLIGGGTLLGASAGTAAGVSIANLGSNAVLSEAAKLQVVLKEIVIAIQKDTKYFQQILLNVNQQIKQLKDQIVKLKANVDKDKSKIKNLEESVKILEKLVNDAC